MHRVTVVLSVAVLACVLGCVIETKHTIEAHITLDIRHIEEQASDVLDFIEERSDTLPGLEAEDSGATSWLWDALDALDPMPTAYAAELKKSSPLLKQIATKLRERHVKVAELKASECLGENNRGYVELRECDALAESEARNAAQKLLAEENKDRKALYNEIARLNRDQEGVTISMIEGVYALERLKRAKPGEIFQLSAPGEAYNEIKASALGKKLADQCQPAAWVTIP